MSESLGGRAEERALLSGFLDWYRAVVEHKVDGLPLGKAKGVMTPTGLGTASVVLESLDVPVFSTARWSSLDSRRGERHLRAIPPSQRRGWDCSTLLLR